MTHQYTVVAAGTKPGATTEIVLSLKEPTVAGEARVPVQPLSRDAVVDVAVPTC